MKFEIDPETYEEIGRLIHSDESPVGIDAKKTHILILNKLQELSDQPIDLLHRTIPSRRTPTIVVP